MQQHGVRLQSHFALFMPCDSIPFYGPCKLARSTRMHMKRLALVEIIIMFKIVYKNTNIFIKLTIQENVRSKIDIYRIL